jgi:hypothetical protein
VRESERRPGPGRVRVPADVERPDRILAGLTARQLAIVAVAAVVLWGGYVATRRVVPAAAFGAVAVPIAAVATLLALGKVEGVSADRFVLAAWRHRRQARRLVPAPDGVALTPALLAEAAGPPPAPLRLGFTTISSDGTVALGADGHALICRASPVTFSLRTPEEQEALVASFAGYLNSLSDPVEIVVRAEPVDLTAALDLLLERAPGLPHPRLETAAREHARFLLDLAEERTLLRREVLLALRQPARSGGPERLRRRAADASAALAAAGVSLAVLDGTDAAALLARALDPAGAHHHPQPGGGDGPVTAARPRRPQEGSREGDAR